MAGAKGTKDDIPPGTLPVLIERMARIDELKALEANTLEMWRAMTRYELQKESEVRRLKDIEREELWELERQNQMLRRELEIRASLDYPSQCCFHHQQ